MKDSHILLLLCRCFETLIVCPWLFVAIQLYWNFRLCCFYFFPNSALRNRGCGLSMDAAYTWTFTVIFILSAVVWSSLFSVWLAWQWYLREAYISIKLHAIIIVSKLSLNGGQSTTLYVLVILLYVYRDLVRQPAQHRTAGELIPLTLCASSKRTWENIYAQKTHWRD